MDRYGTDILSNNPHPRKRRPVATVEAEYGLVVECASSGFCGSVVRTERAIEGLTVELEDRNGRRRVFVMGPGEFLIDGEPIALIRPRGNGGLPPKKQRTASGSTHVATAARVARGSRIWVEGLHDAELIEKIWGDDLRGEGVVVEPMHGADDLVGLLDDFGPEPGRRVGVLLDHLVAGSKEQRIADAALARFTPNVEVLGHPFVDVWQAVKPKTIGIAAWPTIPKGTSWKLGIIDYLGWDCEEYEAWKRILGKVNSYADLEPVMLGRVEELIDFVTA